MAPEQDVREAGRHLPAAAAPLTARARRTGPARAPTGGRYGRDPYRDGRRLWGCAGPGAAVEPAGVRAMPAVHHRYAIIDGHRSFHREAGDRPAAELIRDFLSRRLRHSAAA
ncbi:hypothetical protein NUM_32290 [Actinocatenispora comari]|uniref:Uncharacterized protein n=1 Tax=Actinocatenispora comari TaxID=2807577 RepID=A0A8J4AC50_9ACTN|nr:hypothetical protein NUM_32290 [Actinocatenispora comari]